MSQYEPIDEMYKKIKKPDNYAHMSDKEYYDYIKSQSSINPLELTLDKDVMGDKLYSKVLKERYREDWAARGDNKGAFNSWDTDNMNNDSERQREKEKEKEKGKGRDKRRENTNPKTQIIELSQFFLNNASGKYNMYEMEAKFGTRGIKPITKLDYDNVVKKLKSLGYVAENESGIYSLKIQTEYLDVASGEFRLAKDPERLRVEIIGLEAIQEYCRTNNLRTINEKHPQNVMLLRKQDVKVDEEYLDSANFDDFNFRVTLKNEERISKSGKIALDIFDNWHNSKKAFRYVNRVTFIHRDSITYNGETNQRPFKIDLSIVRSSSKNNKGWLIQTHNIDESHVFENPEGYELEVEVEESAKLLYKSPKMLADEFQKVIKSVMCGLQKTNYPISYSEQRLVLQEYYTLLFAEEYKKKGEEFRPKDRAYPSDFIGPSLVTLELQNIAPLSSDIVIPNITEPYAYCVTEKADGERHMLFVNSIGKIYLINMSMNIIFTGAKTTQETCFNSLIDGELILHNKNYKFINTFAAFDMYYFNGVDVRAKPFVRTIVKEERYFKDGCRLPMLKEFVSALKAVNIVDKKASSTATSLKDEEGDEAAKKKAKSKAAASKLLSNYLAPIRSPIVITAKNFYPLFDTVREGVPQAVDKYNIFEANNYLLRRIADGLFDYEIDGLIFTPTLLGVGGNKIMEAGPKKKVTWQHCFKWKPSEATRIFPQSYNTIDFLVITKKTANGADVVTPIFENGVNMGESTQFNQYKTVQLTVGFDRNKHGYINPCQDVLDDKFSPSSSNINVDDDEGYKAKQFFPSDPYDPMAGLANIMLEMDGSGTYQMFTEDRQVFEDQMVVEFRYDITKSGLWKWVPMRVRYDKTGDFRSGHGVGANDYNTANNNWHSIHNPVTEQMIATGENIPNIEVSDDVYYNSVTTEKLTKGMRDFHNLYVKKALIQAVSHRGSLLIDFACGKAGDFPKWIAAYLAFVFGIDISKDNLENRLNGACARYLNFRKTTKQMPSALFVNGNVATNIRSGTNMFTDKDNEIVKSVFGSVGLDRTLGKAVEKQHAVAINGFDVSSCQFAIHYMFENKSTFYNFIRNIAECTKLNGYFIATCYDGKTVFKLLNKLELGESKNIYIDDKKVWSITKEYDEQMFDDNESSLGYKVSVYQDSINQTISEYLVNYDFLSLTMEKYGFTLVPRDEARRMGLPEGSGMFSELFNNMMGEISRNPKKSVDYKDAATMTSYEKDISFLNRFFVYKKTSTRNAEKLTKILLGQLPDDYEFEQAGTMMAREAVEEAEMEIKPKVKNLNKKIQLQEAPVEQPEVVKKAVKAVEAKADKIKRTKKQEAPIAVINDESVLKITAAAPPPSEIQSQPQKEQEQVQVKPKAKTTRKKKVVAFDIVEE
jgi:hypothetical protein